MSEYEKTAEAAEAADGTASAAGEASQARDAAAAAPEGVVAPADEESASTEAEAQAEDPVEKLNAELAAEKDRNIRLLADFDNYRRRVTREKNETYQRATEAAIAEFLPVLDNFERAISQAPAAGDPFADGVRMVCGQFSEVLAKAGVKPIEALGAEFNPEEHEAIAYQPSPDAPEGRIIYEAKRGYRFGDRVMRPASVIVSSGAPSPAEPPAGEGDGENEAGEAKGGEA